MPESSLTSVELHMRIAVVVVLLLAGCQKESPNYCPPDAIDCEPPKCTASTGTCVCLNGICVQCTPQDLPNCEGLRPFCGGDNTCRGCRANNECSSDSACLED